MPEQIQAHWLAKADSPQSPNSGCRAVLGSMFSRTFADGVKSLDLQYLGNGLWLLPNGPNILIMDAEGIVYWQLDLENYLYLDGARFSFTNAI
jgi:hypothetical protein